MSEQRTALVTGAGRGIGRAIACRLAKDGYAVIVLDADPATAESVAQEVGGRAEHCDVTDAPAVMALAASVETLDLLVNNAGIYPGGSILDLTREAVHRVMDVNLVGPLLLTQSFLPHLEKSQGSVVTIASVAAEMPTPGTGIYGASKAAVVAMTELCAVELAHTGVRFNMIAPGGVLTEGTAGRSVSEHREQRFKDLVPVGRRALPEDIADVVPFLASADARYITGQVVTVDGGLSHGTIQYLNAAQGD